jgi:hypothetical protein
MPASEQDFLLHADNFQAECNPADLIAHKKKQGDTKCAKPGLDS